MMKVYKVSVARKQMYKLSKINTAVLAPIHNGLTHAISHASTQLQKLWENYHFMNTHYVLSCVVRVHISEHYASLRKCLVM